MKLRRSLAALATVALAACQPDSQDLHSVVVSLPEQNIPNATKATLLVDYSGTGAKIVSEGGSPACAFILPGVDGDFSDDRQGTLTIHTQGPRALRGPADVAACRMKAGGDATPAALHDKLAVRVAGAEDSTGKAIDVTAKAAHARTDQPEKSEAAIEAAQAEAVRAAASVAAAAPPAAPAAAATPGSPTAVPGPPGAPVAGSIGPGNANVTPRATGNVVPGPPAAPTGNTAGRPQPEPFSRPLVVPVDPATLGGGDMAGNDSTGDMGGGDGGGDNTGGIPSDDADPSYDDSCEPPPPAYTVEIQVSTAVGNIGALQLEVTHLGRSGCFMGRGDQVQCSPLVDALVAANYPGERTAKIGFVSLQGFRTPSAIMRCGFRTKEALTSQSFAVNVADASSPKGDALDPPPEVNVTISRR